MMTRCLLHAALLGALIPAGCAGVVGPSTGDLSSGQNELVEFREPVRPTVVGANGLLQARAQDTLTELALQAGVGYLNLVHANPGIDPWLPREGEKVLLPYAAVLPADLQPGITINLAEMRLYYLFGEERKRLKIYPVGIGSDEEATPEGEFAVISKIPKPVWVVPPAVRRERGLPAVVEPGPDNPLGDFWLGFTAEGHGIHGTNQPFAVGRRLTRGCIRLYPGHIDELFQLVEIGTPVRIIYQPLKVGLGEQGVVVEAHPDYLGRQADPCPILQDRLADLGWARPLDEAAVRQALEERRGVPVLVSPRPRGLWRKGS